MQGLADLHEPETSTLHLEGGFPAFDPRRLRGFERLSVPICNFINTTPAIKGFIQFFVRTWTAFWIGLVARSRWQIHGEDSIRAVDGGHGVVLVANHRSFFDMYVASAMLYRRSTFMDRLYFPVRSKFFYSSPLGLLVNLSVSGCAMWPPVFRDDRKDMNPASLHQSAWALNKPGAVLGYHPEGTRGKGPDPYEFLPAKKGIGKLLRCCHPDTRVLPFFTIGMGSDFIKEVLLMSWQGHRGDAQRMIRMWFGEGLRVGDVVAGRSDQEVADYLMGVIGDLSQDDVAQYGAWTPT